jgi:hypothetical protein
LIFISQDYSVRALAEHRVVLETISKIGSAVADLPCGNTGNDGEGFDIPRNYRTGRDNRSVTDLNARQDDRSVSNPHVAPDDDIAPVIGELAALWVVAQRQY